MMNSSQQPIPIQPPSRRELFWRVLAALAVATTMLILVVLPAEFSIDPTGLGKRAGLLGMSNPSTTAIAHFYPTPFRSDVIDVPLEGVAELEYKLRMKEGETLAFSWSVVEGTLVYADFHGESSPGMRAQVQSYRKDGKYVGIGASHGSLIAPFDGIHGWYWVNLSDDPIVIRLRVSGFYQIINNE